MALVKYLTETQITTQPISHATINDALKLNNKELLLVSLLEKLCQTIDGENHLFKNICHYLNQIGLLEDRKLYSDNKKMVRKMYTDYLTNIICQCSQTIKGTSDPINSLVSVNKLTINNSLYAMNFVELQNLGNGGFGSVYKVYNRIDTREYAIKIVPFTDVNDPNNIRAFNEVRCFSELEHKNVARYYTSWLELIDKNSNILKDTEEEEDDDEDENILNIYPVMYIQMELCTGNLRDFLDNRNKSISSGLITDFVIEKKIIDGIIQGMTYIHSKNVVHRDLNPKNIFLDSNNLPKIGDFGMSIKINDSHKNNFRMSSGLGVRLYMPPEYEQNNIYTTKSDVYSVGLIFFDILHAYKTDMERYEVMSLFKETHQYESVSNNLKKYLQLIVNMTDNDPSNRPDFTDILSQLDP